MSLHQLDYNNNFLICQSKRQYEQKCREQDSVDEALKRSVSVQSGKEEEKVKWHNLFKKNTCTALVNCTFTEKQHNIPPYVTMRMRKEMRLKIERGRRMGMMRMMR